MLTAYPTVQGSRTLPTESNSTWIDLLNPTKEEITSVETKFRLTLPSREELSEIESSSRISEKDGMLFLSLPIVANAQDLDEDPSPLGFVLGRDFLITIRYAQLRSFETVAPQFSRPDQPPSSTDIFSTLVEEMVDVSADLLEEIAGELDGVSKLVFKKRNLKRRHPNRSNDRLHNMLVEVGNVGERLSRVRDSLLGLQRIVPFVSKPKRDWISSELQTRLESAQSDLLSLTDYETHLYSKVQFLLDAVLGFMNTKQNDIFTVLTIVGHRDSSDTCGKYLLRQERLEVAEDVLTLAVIGCNDGDDATLSWHKIRAPVAKACQIGGNDRVTCHHGDL
jgi:magnesium transporter